LVAAALIAFYRSIKASKSVGLSVLRFRKCPNAFSGRTRSETIFNIDRQPGGSNARLASLRPVVDAVQLDPQLVANLIKLASDRTAAAPRLRLLGFRSYGAIA